MAYAEAQVVCHARLAPRADGTVCAGCGEPIGNRIALNFVSGARVHFDCGNNCLVRYGRRWRGAASKLLERLGIPPPASWRDVE